MLACLPWSGLLTLPGLGALQDPIEDKFPDESTQAVLRRNRISSTQQLARANSRGSNAGHRGRSHAGSPAYDPFLPSPSQVQPATDSCKLAGQRRQLACIWVLLCSTCRCGPASTHPLPLLHCTLTGHVIVEQSHANSHRTDPIFDKDDFPPDLPELGSKGNDDISIGDQSVCLYLVQDPSASETQGQLDLMGMSIFLSASARIRSAKL